VGSDRSLKSFFHAEWPKEFARSGLVLPACVAFGAFVGILLLPTLFASVLAKLKCKSVYEVKEKLPKYNS